MTVVKTIRQAKLAVADLLMERLWMESKNTVSADQTMKIFKNEEVTTLQNCKIVAACHIADSLDQGLKHCQWNLFQRVSPPVFLQHAS